MDVVVVTLAATLLIQIGYFFWKIAADRAPRFGSVPWQTSARAMMGDSRWLAGLLATILGWLLFVQATALGEISLVQPLMSVGDLLFVVMVVVFLHERIGRIEWIGIVQIVLGAAALAGGAMARHGVQVDLARLGWVTSALLLAGAALLAGGRRSAQAEFYLGTTVGIAFGLGAVLTEALSAQLTLRGQSVWSWATLTEPMLAAVIVANVLGLVLLQMAFQRGRAAVVVPLQLAITNFVAVGTGILVFAETISAARAIAIVLIVAGTAALQRGRANHPEAGTRAHEA